MSTDTPPSIPWKCTECRTVFNGPTNRAPSNGCPHCGSRACFDTNVSQQDLLEVHTFNIITWLGPN